MTLELAQSCADYVVRAAAPSCRPGRLACPDAFAAGAGLPGAVRSLAAAGLRFAADRGQGRPAASLSCRTACQGTVHDAALPSPPHPRPAAPQTTVVHNADVIPTICPGSADTLREEVMRRWAPAATRHAVCGRPGRDRLVRPCYKLNFEALFACLGLKLSVRPQRSLRHGLSTHCMVWCPPQRPARRACWRPRVQKKP